MKIVLTGGTGLVGKALVSVLADKHDLIIITRDKEKAKSSVEKNITIMAWEALEKALLGCDVVIHLAGENIGARFWTKKQKARILSSRLLTTQKIVNACLTMKNPPRLINASAIGIYGLKDTLKEAQETLFTESSSLPSSSHDFLTEVGQAWEGALQPAIEKGLSVTCLRFAVILSPKGGMLKKVLLPFKLGLGGRVGSGAQPFSWVALHDVIRAIQFILDKPDLSGPFNIVAPERLSQLKFAKILAKALHRPAVIPMPAMMVKLLFGEMGECLLLKGQAVSGERLKKAGFQYEHETLESLVATL
jgi:hypothetical protein